MEVTRDQKVHVIVGPTHGGNPNLENFLCTTAASLKVLSVSKQCVNKYNTINTCNYPASSGM